MFRIIATENVNRTTIETLAQAYFTSGFTLLEGKGFWGKVSEDSLLILVAGEVNKQKIIHFCDEVKTLNNQECLMVVELPGEVSFY
jgi:hypothetical protein